MLYVDLNKKVGLFRMSLISDKYLPMKEVFVRKESEIITKG